MQNLMTLRRSRQEIPGKRWRVVSYTGLFANLEITIKAMPLDLTKETVYEEYETLLEKEAPKNLRHKKVWEFPRLFA